MDNQEAVSDNDMGTAIIADTREKQEKMLILSREYAQSWNAALNDFVYYLPNSQQKERLG